MGLGGYAYGAALLRRRSRPPQALPLRWHDRPCPNPASRAPLASCSCGAVAPALRALAAGPCSAGVSTPGGSTPGGSTLTFPQPAMWLGVLSRSRAGSVPEGGCASRPLSALPALAHGRRVSGCTRRLKGGSTPGGRSSRREARAWRGQGTCPGTQSRCVEPQLATPGSARPPPPNPPLWGHTTQPDAASRTSGPRP